MADNTHSDPKDMSVRLNRLDFIERYNRCLGAPGPGAEQVQADFIDGAMDPRMMLSFVAEYEVIIESRRPMRKPSVP